MPPFGGVNDGLGVTRDLVFLLEVKQFVLGMATMLGSLESWRFSMKHPGLQVREGGDRPLLFPAFLSQS